MSGLGGQGVVTAAHILGSAAYREGKNSLVNPFFGAEKRLAPSESYVRISTGPIHDRGEVRHPNIIMVFHPHVISLGKCYTMPFFEGLQPGGLIVVNADSVDDVGLTTEEVEQIAAIGAKVYQLPASKIANEVGGTTLSSNMAMLGGLVGTVPDLIDMESLRLSIRERFGGGKFVASATTAALDDVLRSKFRELDQLVEQNMRIVEAAAASVSEFRGKGISATASKAPEAAMYVSTTVIPERCEGCGICILYCPEPNAFRFFTDDEIVSVDGQRCKGCALCVSVCTRDALTVSEI
jgi:pyruvate ferredoxin oxidoreductase gamma subunit